MAPEVLQKDGYSEACDWWSVGVIMYEMLVGFPPFCCDTPAETYRQIVNWKQTLQFSEECRISAIARDLIERLCCDQRDRLCVEEIKIHAFF